MDTRLTYAKPDPDIVDLLSKELDCHPVLAGLIAERGIQSVQEARLFLNPGFDQLSDPFSLKDMDKAVQRIYTAVVNKEKILIFGDFDADGVTATALLSQFLEHCDANISWYIPHRFKEGYSLHENHVQMAVEQNIDLIITVDCGITSNQAVELARLEDIDVIITDHHEAGAELPKASAVIDPKQKDCPSSLQYLAGVGVAFFLVMALRKHFRSNQFFEDIKEPNLSDYLDLFSIGTIGDMVPLVGDNRVLSICGIKKLRQGNRMGLKTLAQIGKVDIAQADSDDISFKIVPRINAAGRVSHARICVSQLMDTDPVSTDRTAALMDQLNTKRQLIEQEIFQDIENKIALNPSLLETKILFLWDDLWDPSVLGIVASKLSRKYCLPTILLSSKSEYAIGSGRSINQINIYKALKANQTLLEKFGGHAMASGLTVKKENLKALSLGLDKYIQSNSCEKDFQKQMSIDAIISLDDITFDLAKQIDRLRPFGTDNPEPVFMCHDVKVISSYLIGNRHRKMILEKQSPPFGHLVEAFHFNINDPDDMPDTYSKIIFKLKINKFKPGTAQIILEHI